MYCFVFLFQTLRTCPQQFRKNCLMRCWTGTYKKVKPFLFRVQDFAFHKPYQMLCLQYSCPCFERERNQIEDDNDGLAAWQTPWAPSHKLYTITGRPPSIGSIILLVFSLLVTQCFCLPACHSGRRSVFIVCTVSPNQPNWVSGISLIPIGWLYFPLSPHTHAQKTHTFKRHQLSSTHSLLCAAYSCVLLTTYWGM